MAHGVKEDYNNWFWTDGNDVDNTGVWRHAYDNSEMEFFPPRVNCGCTDSKPYCSNRGDAFILYMSGAGGDKQARGNYCDNPSSSVVNFICERN